jgi:plastocyanin
VTFTIGENSFGPTFVKVKPGAHVAVTIDSDNPFTHNFVIDGVVKYDITPAKKGQRFSFSLPTDGPVRFYCTFHVSRGMQGAFYFA